ncbi:unnamed protein product [Diatraea saccharalis]|uniref:Uncharacterized protein n=1 Tax=Diatraea saccharalis TaxID=40085 RepID=A0A9P0G1W4_9NEOP|nr:unnamed protein product [Diatraea saccharalis]
MVDKIDSVSKKVDENDKYVADLEQALTVVGIGRYNLKYCMNMTLFLNAAIIEPLGYSYILPAARCDLDMSDTQRGFIASVPYIGKYTLLLLKIKSYLNFEPWILLKFKRASTFKCQFHI